MFGKDLDHQHVAPDLNMGSPSAAKAAFSIRGSEPSFLLRCPALSHVNHTLSGARGSAPSHQGKGSLAVVTCLPLQAHEALSVGCSLESLMAIIYVRWNIIIFIGQKKNKCTPGAELQLKRSLQKIHLQASKIWKIRLCEKQFARAVRHLPVFASDALLGVGSVSRQKGLEMNQS